MSHVCRRLCEVLRMTVRMLTTTAHASPDESAVAALEDEQLRAAIAASLADERQRQQRRRELSGGGGGGEAAALRIVSWNVGLRGLKELCSTQGSSAPDVHGIARRQGFGSLAAASTRSNHQTASAAFYSHAAPRTSERACTQS